MQPFAQICGTSVKMRPSDPAHPKPMASLPIRTSLLLLLSGISLCAYAEKPVPGNLEPLPPPPPVDSANSTDQAPEVTITKKTDQTVEEYRVGGRLYMIKITPKVGKPYYLVDDLGDGKFARQESMDTGLRPPRWVIHRF
jgi:hypothetical protein